MVIAPRIAERPEVLLPVVVCQDGFTITHSAEPVELLPDEEVRRFVGEYRVPYPLLDVAHPTTQGPFAMPDYYYELRHQQIAAMDAAPPAIDEVAAEFEALTGRRYRSIERYPLEGARRAVVALGSSTGTVKEAVDELREQGEPVGLLRIGAFRPFPAAAIAEALADVDTAVVLDRADSPGGAPPLRADVAAALYGSGVELESHVYGLGGRDLRLAEARELLVGRVPTYVGLRSEACRV
jgi:pyruvate ferredoxin oxidoreductase alpha subunit